MKKNLAITILALLILPPILLLLTRQLLPSNYIISSAYKLIFLSPLIYRLFIHKKTFKQSISEGFKFKTFRKKFWIIITIAISLALIYILAFVIFQDFLHLENIAANLNELASINATNIIFIGIYLIFINSLLEEFFWRGFIFKETSKLISPLKANIITGIAFSFHHVMFYYSWFTPSLFALTTIGLIGFAMINNFIFQKYKDLLSCWLIHGAVDIVQIFIALKIFGII